MLEKILDYLDSSIIEIILSFPIRLTITIVSKSHSFGDISVCEK